MRIKAFNPLAILGVLLLTSACSKGGNLTLEPGARKINSKGSPFVQVNQGGRALVVQQGQTPTSGVHGWITVQSMSSRALTSGSGHTAVINKTAKK